MKWNSESKIVQLGIHILPFERGNPSESRTSTLCPQFQLRLAPSLLQMKVMSVAATAISWDACGRPRLNIDESKIDIFSFAILGLVWQVLLFLFPDTTSVKYRLNIVLFTYGVQKKCGEQNWKGTNLWRKFSWSLQVDGMKNFNAVSHNRAGPYFRIQRGRGEVRACRVYLNVHWVTGNVVDTGRSVEFWRWKCCREFGTTPKAARSCGIRR